MRPIKFRAKSASVRKLPRIPRPWSYGGIMADGDEVWLCVQVAWKGVVALKADPETVSQFTGIIDHNGKEIYEGDIITVKGDYPRVVLWNKMMWALMPTIYYHDEVFWVMNLQHPGVDWWEEYADEIEVIGNIHDNPEMLSTLA